MIACVPDVTAVINWFVRPCFRTLTVALTMVAGQYLLADSFVFDPTTNGRVPLPSWLPDRPVATASNHAELSFQISPVADDDDLALTVV